MQYTPNYNFDLPEANDEMETATRTALDDNFTDLDTLLKDIEDDIDDVQDDISDLGAKTGADIPFENGSADSISDKITILYNLIIPVGSVLCFTNDTNPNDIYSGTTWEKIEGRFLLGSSPDYALGSTGGSANAVVVNHMHNTGLNGDANYKYIANVSSAPNTYTGIQLTSGSSKVSVKGYEVNTTSVGESGTGKNMPPYEVVNYWKRTA